MALTLLCAKETIPNDPKCSIILPPNILSSVGLECRAVIKSPTESFGNAQGLTGFVWEAKVFWDILNAAETRSCNTLWTFVGLNRRPHKTCRRSHNSVPL